MSKVKKKEIVPKVDISTLNEDQKSAFNSLVDFIKVIYKSTKAFKYWSCCFHI